MVIVLAALYLTATILLVLVRRLASNRRIVRAAFAVGFVLVFFLPGRLAAVSGLSLAVGTALLLIGWILSCWLVVREYLESGDDFWS